MTLPVPLLWDVMREPLFLLKLDRPLQSIALTRSPCILLPWVFGLYTYKYQLPALVNCDSSARIAYTAVVSLPSNSTDHVTL